MTYSARIKGKSIKIRQQGYSLKEIASRLNIAKSTTSVWLKNIKLSQRAKTIIKQKRKNSQFQPGNTHWQKAKHLSNFISWTPAKLDQLRKLYRSGLSMRQVGRKMNCSLSSINNAMRRYNISRRSSAQTNRIRFYRSPLSFNPKEKLTTKEQQLKTAGLMLYWAEGGKSHLSVDFANSNPIMIKLFTKFLRKIYQVNESRLHCLIYCYPSHKINELTNYWSSLTKIPVVQFQKPYIRKDGGNIRDKMKHGLIHIRYSDKRLLELIMKEIRQLSYNI